MSQSQRIWIVVACVMFLVGVMATVYVYGLHLLDFDPVNFYRLRP